MIDITARMRSQITTSDSDESESGAIEFTISESGFVIITVNGDQHHWVDKEDFKMAVNAVLNNEEEEFDDNEEYDTDMFN